MTNPANDPNKPSPSDTPTERPDDNGHKSIVEKEDKQYSKNNVDFGNIQKKYENEEEPVDPITTPPTENQGMKEGKVQP